MHFNEKRLSGAFYDSNVECKRLIFDSTETKLCILDQTFASRFKIYNFNKPALKNFIIDKSANR